MELLDKVIWIYKNYRIEKPQKRGEIRFAAWGEGAERWRLWRMYKFYKKLDKKYQRLIVDLIDQDDHLVVETIYDVPDYVKRELEWNIWYEWCAISFGNSVDIEYQTLKAKNE
jgi:hypothetical protein